MSSFILYFLSCLFLFNVASSLSFSLFFPVLSLLYYQQIVTFFTSNTRFIAYIGTVFSHVAICLPVFFFFLNHILSFQVFVFIFYYYFRFVFSLMLPIIFPFSFFLDRFLSFQGFLFVFYYYFRSLYALMLPIVFPFSFFLGHFLSFQGFTIISSLPFFIFCFFGLTVLFFSSFCT